jgi:hypothetical protein
VGEVHKKELRNSRIDPKKIEKSQKKFPVRIVLVMFFANPHHITFGTHEVYTCGGFAVCEKSHETKTTLAK